ncbi:MAG: GAF domain-containing protein [Candidatus Coatesbacteria bacterium]|nr:GAF domain-containing protein [Candidatus Coatesbacteria bacterium]
MNEMPEIHDIALPEAIVGQWQKLVDLIARVMKVPAAFVMRAQRPELEVYRASENPENPIPEGTRMDLAGLYCERVMDTKERLFVPNALEDEEWRDKPGAKAGLISYLGFPLEWPNGEVFGTICTLDTKERAQSNTSEDLLSQFRQLAEAHLALAYQNKALDIEKVRLEKALNEIKTLRGLVPICACCKKVRDDTGFWQSVEVYVGDRTEADFTHGVCPECEKKLYPPEPGDEDYEDD